MRELKSQRRRNKMPLILEETKSLVERLDLPENWFLAYNIDTFSNAIVDVIKNAFPINAVPNYIEDELIGLQETLELTAQCYRNCLGNIINYLREELDEHGLEKLEEKMDREIRKVKKVIAKDSDKEMKAMKGLEKKDKVMDKKMEKCESTMSKKKK